MSAHPFCPVEPGVRVGRDAPPVVRDGAFGTSSPRTALPDTAPGSDSAGAPAAPDAKTTFESVRGEAPGARPQAEARRLEPHATLFKLIALLLDYPRDELWRHGEELCLAADGLDLGAAQKRELARFVREMLAEEPLQAQSRWIETFDRGRAMSLLMFEHIHGESRDRGQAMVDLLEQYRQAGLVLDRRELPDYLPLLLEFLSLRPIAEAQDWLSHLVQVLGLLEARAAERHSPYALLFRPLVEFAGGTAGQAAFRSRAANEARDDSPAAMDAVWEEEAVRFGAEAPSSDCNSNRSPASRQRVPAVE